VVVSKQLEVVKGWEGGGERTGLREGRVPKWVWE
jgi:hypothetical protein